jgi:Ca2+-binding EF-hand superfamily protein
MFSFMPTPLDFPAYLTYITSLKTQVSSREELSGAFTAFDERDSGFITYDDLKQDLVTTGPHRMTEEQVENTLRPFVEKTGRNRGKVCYTKFLDAMMGEQNLQRNKNDHMTT